MSTVTPKEQGDDDLQKSGNLQTSTNETEAVTFQNLHSITKEFFESTTTHGLSRIYSARNVYIRGFWLMIFLVVFALLGLSVYCLIIKVTSYSVVTSIQAKLHTGLQFPAITFCNGNPFRESEMIKPAYADYRAANITRGSTKMELKLVMDLGGLSDSELYNLGHPSEIFLMQGMGGCFFQNKPCNITEDFVSITSPVHGNCFTYKSKDRIQSRVNSESGLFTTININQEDYSSYSWSTVAGAKVMIHQPDEFLPESQAIYLAPGTWTDIKIEKKITKRLKAPYTDHCSDEKYMTKTIDAPVRYTTELCQNVCYVNLQMADCGYTTPFFSSALKSTLSILGTGSKDLRYKYKTAENVSQIDCLMRFDEKFLQGKVNCSCSPPCYEEQFKITTSSAMWPPSNKAVGMLYELQMNFEPIFNNWTVETLYNNIVAANIYYKDLTVETIEQKPEYEMDDFASDLGGQMGLWIGSSVFSGFEFGAFALSLLLYLIFLRRKDKVHTLK